MNLEIERKFKVADDWQVPDDARGVQVRQAYLSPPGADAEFRIRAKGDRRLMTVKAFEAAANTMVRREVEFEIEEEPFAQLWTLAQGECLSKYRWSVPIEGYVASVDVYDGVLSGLRVVEVEFDSVEEANRFIPPPWFGEEITGHPTWGNRRLAAVARARTQEAEATGAS
ncbi:CYTH domain-containing protein [Nonomuraea sp. NPDC050691]|uniref:CYTH domain-containing protein n=1 Tax=Nonomuraea sp. NPDC050691 TaxID=3155661 RepID=UPI0033ED7D41